MTCPKCGGTETLRLGKTGGGTFLVWACGHGPVEEGEKVGPADTLPAVAALRGKIGLTCADMIAAVREASDGLMNAADAAKVVTEIVNRVAEKMSEVEDKVGG